MFATILQTFQWASYKGIYKPNYLPKKTSKVIINANTKSVIYQNRNKINE